MLSERSAATVGPMHASCRDARGLENSGVCLLGGLLSDELSDNSHDKYGTQPDVRGQNSLVSRSIDKGQRTAEDRSHRRGRTSGFGPASPARFPSRTSTNRTSGPQRA